MEEIEQLVRSLNRTGALKVLNLLAKNKEMGFNKIAKAVGYPSMAGRILKDFKRLGLVRKKEMKDRLGTVMYGLTTQGYKVKALLDQMKSL